MKALGGSQLKAGHGNRHCAAPLLRERRPWWDVPTAAPPCFSIFKRTVCQLGGVQHLNNCVRNINALRAACYPGPGESAACVGSPARGQCGCTACSSMSTAHCTASSIRGDGAAGLWAAGAGCPRGCSPARRPAECSTPCRALLTTNTSSSDPCSPPAVSSKTWEGELAVPLEAGASSRVIVHPAVAVSSSQSRASSAAAAAHQVEQEGRSRRSSKQAALERLASESLGSALARADAMEAQEAAAAPKITLEDVLEQIGKDTEGKLSPYDLARKVGDLAKAKQLDGAVKLISELARLNRSDVLEL